MLNPEEYAQNLEERSPGFWVAKSSESVSYGKEGHASCMAVEDQSFWFKHRNACIVQLMSNFPPNGPVFDIGGGNGFVTKAIQRSGFETVLVEPGIDGALNAQSRGILPVICSSFDCADFRKGRMPAAGLFDVVEHIESDQNFLQSLNQVLANEARVYVTVPSYNFLWSEEDDYAGHFRRYTVGQLERVFEESGFEIEYSTYIFSFLVVPIFFVRSLPYFLGFRKPKRSTLRQNVHRSGGAGIVSRILSWLLNLEVNAINRKRKFPFGGSVLLVAKKIVAKGSI